MEPEHIQNIFQQNSSQKITKYIKRQQHFNKAYKTQIYQIQIFLGIKAIQILWFYIFTLELNILYFSLNNIFLKWFINWKLVFEMVCIVICFVLDMLWFSYVLCFDMFCFEMICIVICFVLDMLWFSYVLYFDMFCFEMFHWYVFCDDLFCICVLNFFGVDLI